MGPSMSCLSIVSVNTLLQKMTLDTSVQTMTLDHIVVTMTLHTIVAFDTIFAFGIPLVALLTSSPLMWRKEHLWNFSALQISFCDGPSSNLQFFETKIFITWEIVFNIFFSNAPLFRNRRNQSFSLVFLARRNFYVFIIFFLLLAVVYVF
jgi:hypothetical protein